MSIVETIERLAATDARLPGSDGERATVELLTRELEQLGREAEVEQVRVRPDHHIAQALHVALAVAGTIVSTSVPPLGVVILLFAAASMYLDLTARFYIVRNLLPRRTARNVSSPGGNADARARLVITAHHDSGRTGLLYGWLGTRLPGPLGRMASPLDFAFWTVALALLLAALRLVVGGSGVFTGLQFVVAVALLLELALLLDAGFSEPSPGASNNASGVAAALELARAFEQDPVENLDLWIVFTAAEQGLMLGMRDWMRKRRSQLKRKLHLFVNLDTVGNGGVRYVTGEGFVGSYQHDRHMIELCESIAQELPAAPQTLRIGTDGVLPAIGGHPSITICCLDEDDRAPHVQTAEDVPGNVDRAAVERAAGFAEALIRDLNAEIPAPGTRTRRAQSNA